MTPRITPESLAQSILRAAGSDLGHYSLPMTRAKILAAAQIATDRIAALEGENAHLLAAIDERLGHSGAVFRQSPTDGHPATCRKCGSTMVPGIATGHTFRGGAPDFPGDDGDNGHVGTFSAGGPGRVIACLKCPSCGWSVSAVRP